MDRTVKVVLLGEGRVGKTSILVRYSANTFSDREESTIDAAFRTKRLNINDERIVMNIWDTAGQERFHALGPIYYRDADAALLVFDVTDAQSFQRVKTWVKELRQMVGKEIVIAIAANKIDLEKNRQVDMDEADKYAQSVGAALFPTSAKLNKGINDVFTHVAKKLLAKSQAATAAVQPDRRTKAIRIEADDSGKKGKGGCC